MPLPFRFRVCQQCGESLSGMQETAKFCSAKCRQKHFRLLRTKVITDYREAVKSFAEREARISKKSKDSTKGEVDEKGCIHSIQ